MAETNPIDEPTADSSIGVDLSHAPWSSLHGPALTAMAGALQLIPENVPGLVRLQRLAAVGAALPALRDPKVISPSQLRSVLKNDFIGGAAVRRQEDLYDDSYVAEVAFHGGPFRVMQGLSSRSAEILQRILRALFAAGVDLPARFLDEVEHTTTSVLRISDAICAAAELERNLFLIDLPRGRPITVPATGRLEQLVHAVVFERHELRANLSEAGLVALHPLSVNQGEHLLTLDGATDDGLVVTPLVRWNGGFIVANPAELITALRHRILVLATEYRCTNEVARLLERDVGVQVNELFRVLGANRVDTTAVRTTAGLPVLRFAGASGTEATVLIAYDQLDAYQPNEPYGAGMIDMSDAVDSSLAELRDELGVDSKRYVVVVTESPGRGLFIGLGDVPELAITATADELSTVIWLDGADPLVLWRYAQAESKFALETRFFSYSMLDTYAIYRHNQSSFYLSDGPRPTFVPIEPGSGAALRKRLHTQVDRHWLPAPWSKGLTEVIAVHGAEIAPIYRAHPRNGLHAAVVELPRATVWVVAACDETRESDAFLSELIETTAFWIWQMEVATGEWASESATDLVIRVQLTEKDAWVKFLSKGETPPPLPESTSWVECTRTPAGIELVASPCRAPLLLVETNDAERELVHALLTVLDIDSSVLQVVAPRGLKRMLQIRRGSELRNWPAEQPVRYVQDAVIGRLLDDLGTELCAADGNSTPSHPSDPVALMNKAVGYYFERLADLVGQLDQEGLVPYLIRLDEALLAEQYADQTMLPYTIGCFGSDSRKPTDMRNRMRDSVLSAISSRFLIEYVAAMPPAGTRSIDLAAYDELLALASQIYQKGVFSDAIKYKLSDATVSVLPSGRLGISRSDSFTAAVNELALVAATLAHDLAAGDTGIERPNPDVRGAQEQDAIDAAMVAEFGFTHDDLLEVLGFLATISIESGAVDVASLARRDVVSQVARHMGWEPHRTQSVLAELTLKSRANFSSEGPDAYPWRYSRNQSYLRRPLILCDREDLFHWGSRRLFETYSYWLQLTLTARIRDPRSAEMKHLVGSIRKGENQAFELQVESALSQGGATLTAARLKKISGRRIAEAGQDLGDIDAIAVDSRRKLIFVAEAKDFESARIPSEIRNELESLFIGEKSTEQKHLRRAEWVRRHLALALGYFNIATGVTGWRVVPVIVTSRPLASPLIRRSTIPVVSLSDLPEWMSRQARIRPKANSGRKGRRSKRSRSPNRSRETHSATES